VPTMQNGDASLYYEIDGADDAPVLILSNSLGTDLGMWAPQMAALTEHFRVVRFDTRGHGQSSVTPGPYSVAQLGGDVIALMDHLAIPSAHFCGLSMGGMTGMWLAVHHPQRIRRLVLANTAARIGNADGWNARIAAVERDGMGSILPVILDRWFTDGFRQRDPATIGTISEALLRTTAAGYAANCGAVRDMDQRETIGAITAPTLVIAGTHDLATPAADGMALANAIPGAAYVELDAAHLSNLEQAAQFTAQILDFLKQG
jgi:3-oxoadipate enol-lactonase